MIQAKGGVRARDGGIELPAREMAEQLTLVFQAHDTGDRESAIRACHAVDRRYFAHVEEGFIEQAARAFVDALWRKNEVEFSCLRRGASIVTACETLIGVP